MKKFFLALILFFLTATFAFADVIPSTTKSIKHYGFGVLNMKNSFCVYEQPSETSKVLKKIDFEVDSRYQPVLGEPRSYDNTLIVYSPSKSIALIAVLSNSEDGWYEVYYDQKNGYTGWVKQTDINAFKTWRNAFYDWGKKNGLYFFKDVPDEKRRLYSQDSLDSQALETFAYPKYINFSMIRGNWMLVSVLDIGQYTKIGWVKWREDDGTLLLFPSFK